MGTTVKRWLAAFAVTAMATLSYAPAASAAGVVFGNNPICSSRGQASGACQSTTANPVNRVLRNAVTLAGVIAGAVGVIFIVVGGIQFVLSAGDPAKAESARNTIIYALVGLLVAAVASGVVSFVLARTTQ